LLEEWLILLIEKFLFNARATKGQIQNPILFDTTLLYLPHVHLSPFILPQIILLMPKNLINICNQLSQRKEIPLEKMQEE
jgi:hypothetical protein